MKKLLKWILPAGTVLLTVIIYACNKQLNLQLAPMSVAVYRME